ncbi:hypothetical protein NF27_JQ00050, partial [Candidatus Jidaibacter acanthamoeba]
MSIKLRSIRDIVSYIREIFDSRNYQNITFFKVVVISVIVIIAIWLFSSIYFANKVYNFVTERVTTLQDKANHEITTKGESLSYLGHTLIKYKNDEREAANEVYRAAQKRSRSEKQSAQEAELNRAMGVISNMTYEQAISERAHEPVILVRYLESCSSEVYSWLPQRSLVVQTKLKVLEKYKQELATRTDWDKGEKRAKEDYIKEYGSIDPNITISHLLKLLKEKQPEELMLESHTLNGHSDTIESLEKMHICMNKSEEVLKALYYFWYDYAETNNSGWNFHKLQSIANNLQLGQDLDFSVINIITEEAQRFKTIPGYRDSRPLESMREYLNRGQYKDRISLIMAFFAETNDKLAQLNPNNMGFKTNAFQFRMREYNSWKAKWDEM